MEVEFILLDSSPYSKFDVLDQSWFEGVVFLYESGFRVPTVLRGGYELGERIAAQGRAELAPGPGPDPGAAVADRPVQRADPVRIRLHLPF